MLRTNGVVTQVIREVHEVKEDLGVLCLGVPAGRWILLGLEKVIYWERMCFKPAHSKAMVLKMGKVMDKFLFYLDGSAIPSINEKPVKSLGKVFDSSLRDAMTIQASIKECETWLATVDKPGLPDRYKTWIYQCGILP